MSHQGGGLHRQPLKSHIFPVSLSSEEIGALLKLRSKMSHGHGQGRRPGLGILCFLTAAAQVCPKPAG